jgi:uncharacterized protein (DUF488 family)
MGHKPLLYTVGHSNHDLSAFIDLLRGHQITLVADVRSQPYSRWASQFNKETLARSLRDAGLAYEFLGTSLGGRPEDPALYDLGAEHPDYRRVEQTPEYQTGIDRLLALAQAQQVVIMCGEGDHHHCHRHLLIAQTLLERGVRVLHIQPDGSTVQGEQIPRQLSLF